MASAAVQLPTGNTTLPTQKPVTGSSGPHHVQTTLNYIKELPDGSHLAPAYVGVPSSYERPSAVLPVTIHDVSGHELDYTLDGNGFQFYYHTSAEKDFLDEDKIKQEYYPEIDQLLKDATNCTRTFIFDHTIRRPSSTPNTPHPASAPRYAASTARVKHHLPDLAPSLLKSRYQIINVWRPIKTITRDPLAVADAHTVPDSDLIPTKLIYPDREGETCSVKPNPDVKWYYRHRQGPDLVTLIKCFDSKTDGRARRVPHSAFVVPGTEGEPARESIEVRVLVFHEDDLD
ncbi:7alpha-cephem-methoxylase P8 chain related protein [Aspergillus sclerotioniger CBS 115572]|uniref:7alpha-cephem-methoxylase P8 chain related protein n=1 Tax=Aspergillus sclerotioniger CBS 115572 TaxID=1450535 RepID=A0A317V9U5_9EURO|nr:7alpha-cephem-methoxylase P8 chain related protein [Aspergillus sclerotioniger CBS 115572]PWY70835.1 7alpha-cephem-methoxylase P8 chain related protein [Aspergillus sclerotioniger CBS 115572]